VQDLFGSLLSLLLNGTPETEALRAINWSAWLDPSLVQTLTTPIPDPVAEAVMQQQLNALASLGFPANNQAIWLQMGRQTLAEHQGTTPLSAASLTKIATTLAALTTWGPEHQFETIVSTNGKLQNGVLQGDLIVQGGGDPFFVWEEAIALGNALNQVGVRQVTGDLIITGNFEMNFEPNAAFSGALLKQGLNAALWGGEATTQYGKLPVGTPRPQVAINGGVRVESNLPSNQLTPLIRHQSLPLVTILKAMNIYSNNAMSEMLANSLGGASVVAQTAAKVAQVPRDEIQIYRGSGLGLENQISPRAVVAMLMAIQQNLQQHKLNLADLFPVAGADGGTLEGRRTPASAVVKTGTLNEVSAFAGVLPTRDRGLVWFAMINLGSGDIGIFHNQQDLLLERLQIAWGRPSTLPVAVQPDPRNRNPINWLGNADRNQIAGQG
jgi:serine-type D-Ala-D-Ala carboxypeptidase/endopeptidase (penicillin-binding protein 4)